MSSPPTKPPAKPGVAPIGNKPKPPSNASNATGSFTSKPEPSADKPGESTAKPGDPPGKPGQPPGKPAEPPGKPAQPPGQPPAKPGQPPGKPGQPPGRPPGQPPGKPDPSASTIASGTAAPGTSATTFTTIGSDSQLADNASQGYPTAPDPLVPDSVLIESEAWALPEDIRAAVAGAVDEDEEYVLNFINGIKNFIKYAVLLGRFPFAYNCPEPGVYEWYWDPRRGRIWNISSIVIFLMSMWFCLNLVALFLNFPRPEGLSFYEMRLKGPIPESSGLSNGWGIRAEELFTFSRNVCSVLIFWSMLLHLVIANYKGYFYRDTQVTFLTYLTNSLATMKVHSGDGMGRFVTKILGFYLGFCGTFIMVGCINFIPVTSGGPSMFAILMVRVVKPEIHTMNYAFTAIKWFMQLYFVYIMLCSKVFVIFYIIQCRLIRQSFNNWNQRLDIVLNRGDNFLVHGNRFGKRTSFRQLFEDHTILLDLLEGHDEYYADTIESYYMSQVISVCFEFYYFFRSITGDEFQESRKFDSFLIGAYSFHSVLFMVFTCLSSSDVADCSMDGLEAVRRKGMFGRKSPEELYFLMSLYVSYGGHFQTALSGSGYYIHDKTFLTTIFGTILSYFIILIQFKTPLDYTDSDMVRLVDRARFIKFMEDTRDIFTGFDSGHLTYLAAANASNFTIPFSYDEY